jgi:hypothetical protein
MAETQKLLKSGPAAAAVLAAGIGVALFGVITMFNESIERVADFFTWYKPAGDLSGMSATSMLAWIAVWIVLGRAWRNKDVRMVPTLVLSVILVVVGVVCTLPPVFTMFAPA